MRKDVLWSEKSIMGAKKFQKSGAFRDMMQNKGVAKVLGGRDTRSWGKRAAFFRDAQAAGKGGFTMRKLKEQIGDYMQGKSRYFSKKDAYELGKAFFKGDKVRYIFRKEPIGQSVSSRTVTKPIPTSISPPLQGSPVSSSNIQLAGSPKTTIASSQGQLSATIASAVQEKDDDSTQKNVGSSFAAPRPLDSQKKSGDGFDKGGEAIDLMKYRKKQTKKENPPSNTGTPSFIESEKIGEEEAKKADAKKESQKEEKKKGDEEMENEETEGPKQKTADVSAASQLENAQSKKKSNYFAERRPERFVQQTSSGKSYFDSMKRTLKYKRAA